MATGFIEMDSSALNLDSLNADAGMFARAILASHPEWEQAARVEPSGEGLAFVVELPPPVAGSPSVFVYADDDEITVAFDRWHAHFDTWAEVPEEEGPTDARAVVEALLADWLAVAVVMRGSEWLGSRTLQADETPPVPPPEARVYVRSWAGSRNSEQPSI